MNEPDERDDFEVIFGNLCGALLVSGALIVLFTILGWPQTAFDWGCTIAGIVGGYTLQWLHR